jgi:tetratricopeptide (TPR) repeat protein
MNWFRKILGAKPDEPPGVPMPAAPPPPEDREASLFGQTKALEAEADLLMSQNKPADAQVAMKVAIAALSAAVKGRNDLPARERWLGALYDKLGSIKVKLGDLDGAAQAFLDSWTVVRVVSDRFPIDPELKADVGIALQKVARVLMLQGRHAEALKFIQDASQIFAGLAAEWNGEPKYRQYFAACTELLGECFTALGKPEMAAELKRQAG